MCSAAGPILLQDLALIDKIAHFDRERIPERVVHAKGAGAHGYFEVTHDVAQYTKAKFLSQVGKKTPVFVRFSTVGGEKGSSDAARDPRGFAIKHYTGQSDHIEPMECVSCTAVAAYHVVRCVCCDVLLECMTEDGLYDMVGNNTPIFFIRDPGQPSQTPRSVLLHLLSP